MVEGGFQIINLLWGYRYSLETTHLMHQATFNILNEAHSKYETLSIYLLAQSTVAHERELQDSMCKILSVLIPYIRIVTLTDLFPSCSFSHAANKLSE